MATIHETLETLQDALAAEFGDDFNNLNIRNYGFQAPGLLDPDKNRSGYQLRGAIGVNNRGNPITVQVLLGKIAPITRPQEESEKLIFTFAHRVALAIAHWQDCTGPGLTQDPEEFKVRFEVTKDQDRKIAGNNKGAWWWVVRWQFEVEGLFNA